MLDFMAHGWGTGSFENDRIPVLVYICSLQLDESGQSLHSHAGHAELLFVREGSGIANVNGKEEPLLPGDFILCGAGEPHSYRARSGSVLTAISCGFRHLHCCGMETNSFIGRQEQPVVHAGTGSGVLGRMLAVLESAAETPDTHSEEICGYLSAAVVTTALRLHRAAAERAEQIHYELATRAQRYLDNHYLESLTLSQIAEAMGVSKFHLDRVFLSRTGCTPVQYITRRRMARAQTLLASTELTVRRVAEQCGYANYNYFTALFRRTVGMTPGEYRKIAQGRTGRRI